MLEIAPFSAIRYDFRELGRDVSKVIAPPYDVLDPRDKSALLARSGRNIVAIDLPYVPPKGLGPPEAYQQAAATLTEWQRDGTLIRESSPAIYVYHQQFSHGGREYKRRMFIARVRLSAFEDGVILPHERTFGGPKEDRLALMKATKCNLSPIFGLYPDAGNQISFLFDSVSAKPPDAHGILDGVENRLWVVTEKTMIDTVVREMSAKKIYIADGHHRYGTALLYRDWLREQHGNSLSLPGRGQGEGQDVSPAGQGRGSSLPDDHPSDYVMFVLAGMDDPGCLILPYFRVLGMIGLEELIEAWRGATKIVPPGDHDIILWDGATSREVPLKFTNRDVLQQLAPDESPAWRQLDYAYLHRYLIDELLMKRSSASTRRVHLDAPLPEPGASATGHAAPLTKVGIGGGFAAPRVEYVKSLEDAKAVARVEHGVALLVKPTPMAHLRAVSESGGLMPQKSTYFYPKLATGLTINPLE